MEQAQLSSEETTTTEVKTNPNRKFGSKVPNKYQVINPRNNAIFNQLSNIAGLDITLGVNLCFYVNKLNHNQLDSLLNTISDPSAKQRVTKTQQKNKPVNWISAISYASQGKNPCDILTESINTYNAFEIDKEGKKVNSYGFANLTFDFSKLPLIKAEDGAPAYPFGIFFFSDIYNNYDNYNAVISCIPNLKNEVSECPYIKPIDFDVRGPVYCNGNFRMNGNFVIFYVTNEIEKQEGEFYPDVTIINIPVIAFRDFKTRYLIKEAAVCQIKKGSTCVSSFIDYICKEIFSFYGVKDNQFIGEVIHAFGYDAEKYNYPLSTSNGSKMYYGGNHVHMGSKVNQLRHDKPFGYNKTNLFNYLDEINKKSNTKIILTTPDSQPSPDGEKKQPRDNKRKSKLKEKQKETVTETGSPSEIEASSDTTVLPQEPDVSFSENEIEAALGNSTVDTIQENVSVVDTTASEETTSLFAEGEASSEQVIETDAEENNVINPDSQEESSSSQGEDIINEEVDQHGNN
jgi:hypothetical protein